MCFRPSAVHANDNNSGDMATCPTCGQPVSKSADMEIVTCPYCGNPIPPENEPNNGPIPPSHNTRIL